MTNKPSFIPYSGLNIKENEGVELSKVQYNKASLRRSVRDFSDKPVSFETVKNIIMTAATAPSGAHKQPWTFCLVSNPEIKMKIREAAEKEEYESYNNRMSEKWLKDLEPIGTDWNKPFLETAPYLIVVFKRAFEYVNDEKWQNYYVNESVGIACGMLINAIHNAGLITLTHTPSPMNFLTKILKRPDNERPYLLLPVGYADENAKVPNLTRKSFEEVCIQFS
ncbi:nitroreductase family protein [Salibacteraceae bacterium]|nr:nitroreductase family protein [Salibacteraceae bacterium]